MGVGFYGNSETNDGVYQLTYSLYNANHTLAGVDSLVSTNIATLTKKNTLRLFLTPWPTLVLTDFSWSVSIVLQTLLSKFTPSKGSNITSFPSPQIVLNFLPKLSFQPNLSQKVPISSSVACSCEIVFFFGQSSVLKFHRIPTECMIHFLTSLCNSKDTAEDICSYVQPLNVSGKMWMTRGVSVCVRKCTHTLVWFCYMEWLEKIP